MWTFRKSGGNRYAEHVEDAGDSAGFQQFRPAHQDAVTSVTPVSAGCALSGSKDKVIATRS